MALTTPPIRMTPASVAIDPGGGPGGGHGDTVSGAGGIEVAVPNPSPNVPGGGFASGEAQPGSSTAVPPRLDWISRSKIRSFSAGLVDRHGAIVRHRRPLHGQAPLRS